MKERKAKKAAKALKRKRGLKKFLKHSWKHRLHHSALQWDAEKAGRV